MAIVATRAKDRLHIFRKINRARGWRWQKRNVDSSLTGQSRDSKRQDEH
jgi:hypothetical protein